MADDKIEVVLEIKGDDTQARRAIKTTEDAGNKLGDVLKDAVEDRAGLAFGRFAGLLSGPVLAAFATVAAAAVYFKKTIDFTIESEKAEKIGKTFDNLTKSLKLSGDTLREGLERASRGMIEDDKLLQAANLGIVSLQKNAAVIPETMELARRATEHFGGDLVKNFETFNEALAKGRVQSLQQFGIFVDADRATKDYARSLGVSVNLLSDAGQKQAIMNAALKEARDRMNQLGESTTQTEAAANRFTAAWGNLKGALADTLRNSALSQAVLGVLTAELDKYTLNLKAKFGPANEQAASKLKLLEFNLQQAQATYDRVNRTFQSASGIQKGFLGNDLTIASRNLREAQNELANFRKELEKVNAEKNKGQSGKFVLLSSQNKGDKPGPDSSIDTEALNRVRATVEQNILSMRNTKLAADAELLRATARFGDQTLAYESLTAARRQLVIDEFELKRANLIREAGENRLAYEGRVDGQIILLEAEKNSKLRALQAQHDEQMRSIRRQAIENDPDASYNNIVESFKLQSEELRNIAQRTAESVRSSFETGFSNAFASFGRAMATGKNGLQEFGKSVLSTLGALCIQLGQFFFLVGTGMSATSSLLGVSGGAAIAAGAALTALGGVLQGLGGDSGGSGGGGAGGGGGAKATAPEIPEQKPQTNVTINVQGHILDRRQSGIAIAEVLTEFFDANDGRLVNLRA